MVGFKFYAVCHSKNDAVNRGIERLGSNYYRGNSNVSVNLITSYSQIYKQSRNTISIPSNHKNLMIDSGAYDFIIKKKGGYPYEPKEYFQKIYDLYHHKDEILPLNYLVSMDLICNPVLNNTDHKNNLSKIKKTINNTIKLFRLFEEKNPQFKLVPVIQGYRIDEYEKCVQGLIDTNILSSNQKVGIGSLANRKKVSEIRSVVKAVSDKLIENNLKDVKIHLFGITLNAIKNQEIAQIISSFDSFSWTFPYRFGRVKAFTGNRMIEANTHKKLVEQEFYEISLRATLLYVDYLNIRFIRQKAEQEYNLWKNNKSINIDNITKENKNHYNQYIKKNPSPPKMCKLLIFSGDKFVLLEPKNVKLSFQERYYIARSSMYQFFDIFKNQKEKIRKRIKNLNNIKSNEIFSKDIIIIDNIFDTIYKYIKNYKESSENYEKFLEKIENIQKTYSNIIPFIGDGCYNNSQTLLDEFIFNQSENASDMNKSLISLMLDDDSLKEYI